MLRGLIRHTMAFPASRQMQLLRMAGVNERVIYVDDFDGALRSLRYKDSLVVADLRALAGSAKAIVAALELIHDKGAAAIHAETGRRSDGRHGAALLAEAVAAIANDRRGPDADDAGVDGAKGAKGGRAKGRNHRKKLMPKGDAVLIWQNAGLTNDEALAKINADRRFKPYTGSTAYRLLGKRKAFAGRRSKKH